MDVVAAAGDKLWKELVGSRDTKATPMKVTSVQLAFTGLETAVVGQKSIDGFFKPGGPSRKRSRENEESVDGTYNPDTDADPHSSLPLSFSCDRCGKSILIPNSSTSAITEAGAEERIAAVRLEHDDYHFAQDLARAPEESSLPPIKATQRKKLQKADTQGIAKFFSRK